MARKKKKNEFESQYKAELIRYLSDNPNQSFNYKQLAFQLNIVDDYNKGELKRLLKKLKEGKQIEENGRGKYRIAGRSHYHTGTIDISIDGRGFFKPFGEDEEIVIPHKKLNYALPGDEVRVFEYRHRRNGRRREGEVVDILRRNKTQFVGTLQLSKHYGYVIPDDKRIRVDFYVPKKYINHAKDGDKVGVELVEWSAGMENPMGKITSILGVPGSHETEIHSILYEYGLPAVFDETVVNEAGKIPRNIRKKDRQSRRDMRKVLTFTIDPADAKDFDDALSFEILDNGNFRIGIHIADVSHYVKPGSLIDREAYRRGTSVYLVDRVVPMLPEVLSNDLCSLRPGEEKLTFSAVFEIDRHARVLNQWFGRTVIFSDRRFTYEEVQDILEKHARADTPELHTALTELDKLAKILRKRRMKNGAITFDKIEVKFELDGENEPTGIRFKHSKDAHKLIEEFMLLANRKVAEYIGKTKNGKPSARTFVYRVHDVPDPDKLVELQQIISQFGYKIDMRDEKKLSKSINKLLEDIKGTPEENMIETLTIRSMSKAVYTTENIGHYGLAFEYYTHFTSPIRRYPDVMVHRLLQHYLDKGKPPKREEYEAYCRHASSREQLATKAERDSIKYMQVKYMMQYIGEEFAGVISGVTSWGVFVEIIDNLSEGLVRIKDIRDDIYQYEEKHHRIVGLNTGNTYRLGDKVRVEVYHADLEKKQLDFTLLGHMENPGG